MNTLFIIAGVGLVFLLSAKKTRGIRNNNPGNLKRNGVDWIGLSDIQNDPVFFQFKTPFYGIRALAKTLLNYYEIHDLTTVQEIIGRWAPPEENVTSEYVTYVAHRVGLDPNEYISINRRIFKLVSAVIQYENGSNPFSDELIKEAIKQAQ